MWNFSTPPLTTGGCLEVLCLLCGQHIWWGTGDHSACPEPPPAKGLAVLGCHGLTSDASLRASTWFSPSSPSLSRARKQSRVTVYLGSQAAESRGDTCWHPLTSCMGKCSRALCSRIGLSSKLGNPCWSSRSKNETHLRQKQEWWQARIGLCPGWGVTAMG